MQSKKQEPHTEMWGKRIKKERRRRVTALGTSVTSTV